MPASRLPGTLRVLLAASFVSAIGSGLTLPFLVIYLHQVRHIPLGISGLLIGGVAVLALPVSPSPVPSSTASAPGKWCSWP